MNFPSPPSPFELIKVHSINRIPLRRLNRFELETETLEYTDITQEALAVLD